VTMERRVEELCEAVQEQVAQVLASGAYQSWADGVQLYGGDLVVFNNSFLFREAIASTVKNSDYLVCCPLNSWLIYRDYAPPPVSPMTGRPR
jgi:hypothetical protein